MKFLRLIENLAPYGLVRMYQKKKKMLEIKPISFWEGYLEYLHNQSRCELFETSPVNTVVSVQGFGFSGSGAVIDLLREYERILVIGFVDKVGSCATPQNATYEVDFLRSAGGLFEIEHYLKFHNIRLQDALLHRFVLLIQSSDLFQNVPNSRKYFYEFFRQICVTFDPFPFQCGNTHLDYKGINNALFLKRMDIKEYRTLCRKLLNSIFRCYPINNSDILVLDQFVGDREYDLQRYLDYVPNLKPIIVYRDPRDVYIFAKEHNVFWIPTSSIDFFVDYFKITSSYLPNFDKLKGYYVTSFERLLSEYEDVVGEIESFIGINKDMHIHPKSALNPDVSMKGVGCWKNYVDLSSDFEKISKELSQFIYYK